jgi:hypothetical protein
MNRSILLGLSAMVSMVGCADLEQPEAVPESSQYQMIARGDRSVDVAARDVSQAALEAAGTNSGPGAPPGCRAGDFCGTSGFSGTGTLLIRVPGESTRHFAGVFSVFNNGNKLPGLDHVQLDWTWPDGSRDTRCIHYNPGPGVFAVNFLDGPITVTRIHWRGECGPNEDF